jgi:hypothetical protein
MWWEMDRNKILVGGLVGECPLRIRFNNVSDLQAAKLGCS